jgi:SAM-dependent methyltransferase
MERMHTQHFTAMPISGLEHRHRYAYARRFARGRVLDIACGIGYGAEFLCGPDKAQTYDGVDLSEPAIAEARSRFDASGRTFAVGDIFSLGFPDETFDAIFTFETLEHVERPADALRELKRVMKRGGVLVGSVPDQDFEVKLTARFGTNAFHHQRFVQSDLSALLGSSFQHVQLGYAGIVIASRVSSLTGESGVLSPSKNLDNTPPSYGSFYFVCSDATLPEFEEEVAGYRPFFEEFISWQDALAQRDGKIRELEAALAKASMPATSKWSWPRQLRFKR